MGSLHSVWLVVCRVSVCSAVCKCRFTVSVWILEVEKIMAEVELFIAAPSEEALKKCTKEQLLKVA